MSAPAVTVMIFAQDNVTNLRRIAWEYLVKPDRGSRHCECGLKYPLPLYSTCIHCALQHLQGFFVFHLKCFAQSSWIFECWLISRKLSSFIENFFLKNVCYKSTIGMIDLSILKMLFEKQGKHSVIFRKYNMKRMGLYNSISKTSRIIQATQNKNDL